MVIGERNVRRYALLLYGAEFDCCSIPFVCSCGVAFSGGVVAGPLLRVERVFGETQEEKWSGIRWCVVACRVAVIVCVLQNEVPKF